MRTRRSPIVLEPPSPATVEMAQVHRVPHGLRLRRVVPRYQSPSALPTEMLPALSNPADRNVRPMFTGTDAINRAPTCDSPLSIKDGGAGSRRVPVEEGSRDTTVRRDGATGAGRHCDLRGARCAGRARFAPTAALAAAHCAGRQRHHADDPRHTRQWRMSARPSGVRRASGATVTPKRLSGR
jgi:hypothetical protein